MEDNLERYSYVDSVIIMIEEEVIMIKMEVSKVNGLN